MLEHLADPLAALREVRRVMKPGGVIGVRDGDWGGLVLAPPNALVEEGLALYAHLWALNGGNPKPGREHRALLRAAGFRRIVASAGADRERLAAIAAEVRTWCEHPNAFIAVLVCEAVGWVD